jgi:hypothetical protein
MVGCQSHTFSANADAAAAAKVAVVVVTVLFHLQFSLMPRSIAFLPKYNAKPTLKAGNTKEESIKKKGTHLTVNGNTSKKLQIPLRLITYGDDCHPP